MKAEETKHRLGDYIRIRTGRLDANAAEPDGQYPFFTCSRECSRINSWAFDCECVLVAGNCTPHVSYYNGKFNAYQRVYVIESTNCQKLSVKYLYYFLKAYMAHAMDKQHGAIEKFFCLSDFTDIEMEIPSLSVQRRIAGVLGSIDEKIEVNRKKINELEALAKTVYDYWFVQFDFPDANGKPYKSSGGKMLWDNTLKRNIPQGWKVVPLGEIAEFANGINYTKENKENEKGKRYRIVNVRDISATKLFIWESALSEISLPSDFADRYVIPPNSIIVARSGIPGAIRLIETTQDVLYSGFVIICRPLNADAKSYLTYFMKSLEGSGATHKESSILNNVSQEMLKYIIVPLPESNTIRQFKDLTDDIFSNITTLQRNVERLTTLRDFLLPLLMNGQVEVVGGEEA